MTLIERLGKLERTLDLAGITKDAATVRAAIARIEAAEDVIEHGTASIHDYRALVREQEGNDAADRS